jgi:hypothetical protein
MSTPLPSPPRPPLTSQHPTQPQQEQQQERLAAARPLPQSLPEATAAAETVEVDAAVLQLLGISQGVSAGALIEGAARRGRGPGEDSEGYTHRLK